VIPPFLRSESLFASPFLYLALSGRGPGRPSPRAVEIFLSFSCEASPLGEKLPSFRSRRQVAPPPRARKERSSRASSFFFVDRFTSAPYSFCGLCGGAILGPSSARKNGPFSSARPSPPPPCLRWSVTRRSFLGHGPRIKDGLFSSFLHSSLSSGLFCALF